MVTMTTIVSFNNVITVEVKRAALVVDPGLSLSLRVTRLSTAVAMYIIANIVTFQCRCHGLNNILYTLASEKSLSFITKYNPTIYNISYIYNYALSLTFLSDQSRKRAYKE